MARKQQTADQQPDTPQLPPLGPGEAPLPIVQGEPLIPREINPYVSDATDAPLVGPPPTNTASIGESASKRRRWRVDANMHVMVRGVRTLLRFGKIVDELNYDMKSLQQQGVPLTELE